MEIKEFNYKKDLDYLILILVMRLEELDKSKDKFYNRNKKVRKWINFHNRYQNK
jgi:hypothetical protein